MTIPYNATKDSSRKYIRESLLEEGIDPTKDELTQIVNAVYNSMDTIVPGANASDEMDKETCRTVHQKWCYCS